MKKILNITIGILLIVNMVLAVGIYNYTFGENKTWIQIKERIL